MYYLSDLVHESRHSELTISDSHYDALEQEMLALDSQLGYNHGKIIDFPRDTPSGKLVIEKMSRPK